MVQYITHGLTACKGRLSARCVAWPPRLRQRITSGCARLRPDHHDSRAPGLHQASDRSSEYRISGPAPCAAWITRASRKESGTAFPGPASPESSRPRSRQPATPGSRPRRHAWPSRPGSLRLSAQIDGQLLQNLSADDTRPAFPQALHERPGTRVFFARGRVMGGIEDVRIDEVPIAHGVRRVTWAASIAGLGLRAAWQARAAEPCRRLFVPARWLRACRSGGH